jgi:hypothetical protein
MDTSIMSVEDFYKENARVGTENVTQEDLPMPMLKLVQRTSDLELANGGRPAFGKFYYTANKQEYDTFPCYFLGFSKFEQVTFNTKGLSDDKKIYETVYRFTGVSADLRLPYQLVCRGAALNQAKNFLGNVVASKKPMFALPVIMEPKIIQGQMGPFAVMIFRVQPVETDMEKLGRLKAMTAKYVPDAIDPDEEITKLSEEGTAFEKPAKNANVEEEESSDVPF